MGLRKDFSYWFSLLTGFIGLIWTVLILKRLVQSTISIGWEEKGKRKQELLKLKLFLPFPFPCSLKSLKGCLVKVLWSTAGQRGSCSWSRPRAAFSGWADRAACELVVCSKHAQLCDPWLKEASRLLSATCSLKFVRFSSSTLYCDQPGIYSKNAFCMFLWTICLKDSF